jgi:cation diffusion facilitator family transporter
VTLPAEILPPIDSFRSDRAYLGADHARNERRTWIVAGVCLLTLVVQVGGGLVFHSMVLIANGVHLGAHVGSMAVAAVAYGVARAHAGDPRLAFGAGKVGYLAGFANAVVLAITALLVAAESLQRLLSPEAVDYFGAIALAAAALAVNLACVWLLRPATVHAHDPDGDLNLSAAHLHLTGDAAVSALAIVGLAAGRWWGWTWADPVAAMVGAALLGRFAWTLLRKAGAVLLDASPSPALTAEVRARLAAVGATVIDLHLWRLGPGHHAAIAVVQAEQPCPVSTYHACLNGLAGLSHVTIEVRDNAMT